MPWIMALIAVLGAAGILGITGRTHDGAGSGVRGVSLREMKSMSEKTVDWLLARLKVAEPPEPVMGAMCYDMAMPMLVDEYVCVVCGEKTVYPDGSWMLTELPECRSLAEGIDEAVDFDVHLVETSLCSHCEPDVTSPALALSVTRDDETSISNAVSRFDLVILSSFLEGRLAYTGDFGDETPLLPHVARIAELLGAGEESE